MKVDVDIIKQTMLSHSFLQRARVRAPRCLAPAPEEDRGPVPDVCILGGSPGGTGHVRVHPRDHRRGQGSCQEVMLRSGGGAAVGLSQVTEGEEGLAMNREQRDYPQRYAFSQQHWDFLSLLNAWSVSNPVS